MENIWSFEITDPVEERKKNVISVAHQERDRRTRAIEIVKMFKMRLERIYPPMIAKEMLSALFRQRGVPSVDLYTRSIIGSFKSGFGCPGSVEGNVRKIMSIGRWVSPNACVTLWMIEPVLSSTIIRGNAINVTSAKENFERYIEVIEPVSMTTSNTTVVGNEIKGRWAGWLVAQELARVNGGNPMCMTCNMSGTSLMFAVHYRGMRVIHMIMTPESIHVLNSYSRTVCANMGTTASLLASGSTKLKVQVPVASGRASYFSLYGNGSMQACGHPNDVEILCTCMLEIVKTVMDTEPTRGSCNASASFELTGKGATFGSETKVLKSDRSAHAF